MKNKEIEELLNELKEVTNSKKLSSTYCITNKHWQLLLSYIEQIEDKINWYENIDINKTIDKFRVEHNKEIKKLHNKIEQLQNNRDKAIEYVEEKGRLKYNPNELINILKGDSDNE